MTSQQEGILWIGIAVVTVLLFTDQNFRDLIFNRGKNATNGEPYTTSQITSQLSLVSTTAIPAGSPNTGTANNATLT